MTGGRRLALLSCLAALLLAACSSDDGEADRPRADTSCTIRTVASPDDAIQCLLQAYEDDDQAAALMIADAHAVEELFDDVRPGGTFVSSACFTNDLCQARWTDTCMTFDISLGRADEQFIQVTDGTVGCSEPGEVIRP